ncbi:MAG: exo-alpha-sialidase [Acidobacteria bacterium]|nr:exo-alpha-sialidase [Acidobacteriota bacterium]
MRPFAMFLLLLCALTAAAADDIQINRIYGPEIPTGKYKHPACITELKNGDLYLVYYGGKGEYANDTSVFGARLRKGETKWPRPRVIAHDPFRSVGNGVIWQGPDGLLWLFYVVRFGETWSESRIAVKISKNNGDTWSDSSMLALEAGMMVRNRPIVLNDGNYLLPVYRETGRDPELVGAESASLFLRFDPRTKIWTRTNEIHSRIGNIQPAPVQIDDNYLVSYSRRGGGYDEKWKGYLVRSESRDGGRTWSEGKESAFPNPNSAVDFLKLRNGHLLLVYNDSMVERTPLTIAISTDNDRSYPYRRNIREGDNSFAYPIALQTQDGRIHIIHTSNQRSVIYEEVFDEEAILKHKAAR